MIPVIRKIGSYFRRKVGADTGLSGPHLCGLCGRPTDPNSRQWSAHRRAYIDTQCIPSIVRAHGESVLSEWLETGGFSL